MDRYRAPRSNERPIWLRVAASGAALLGFLGISYAAYRVANGEDNSARTQVSQDTAPLCFTVGHQDVTLRPGEGNDTLIFDIKGAGKGDGDPCWNDAANVVSDAVVAGNIAADQGSQNTPQIGVTYNIPKAMQEKP